MKGQPHGADDVRTGLTSLTKGWAREGWLYKGTDILVILRAIKEQGVFLSSLSKMTDFAPFRPKGGALGVLWGCSGGALGVVRGTPKGGYRVPQGW